MLLSSDDGFGSTVIHIDYPSAYRLPGISPNPQAGWCCPCAIDPLFYSQTPPPSRTLLTVFSLRISQAAIRVIFLLIMYYSEEGHSFFNRTDNSLARNDRISLGFSFSFFTARIRRMEKVIGCQFTPGVGVPTLARSRWGVPTLGGEGTHPGQVQMGGTYPGWVVPQGRYPPTKVGTPQPGQDGGYPKVGTPRPR